MLEILDTAGSEQFSSLQDLYIRNGQGFVLVYSIASLQSLLDLESVYQQILHFKTNGSFQRSRAKKGSQPTWTQPPPPIVLVGNKADLGPHDREVPKSEADALARRWGCCAFIEASAKTGDAVVEVFREVVLRVSLADVCCVTTYFTD